MQILCRNLNLKDYVLFCLIGDANLIVLKVCSKRKPETFHMNSLVSLYFKGKSKVITKQNKV